MAPDITPPALAVSGVDFGWGSAGKLSAILNACRALRPDLRIIMFGTKLGKPILGAIQVDEWYPEWPTNRDELASIFARHGVRAGLVVLDPGAATAFERAGCPTVYVDSLPNLWTPADRLPTEVSVYCAQRCQPLSGLAIEALAPVRNLIWVEGVISPPDASGRRRRLAVVNVGGLHSPHASGNADYLALVLPAVLPALAGFDEIEVCGNVEPADVPKVDGLPAIAIGPRSHREYLDLLSEAKLLLTSPGLTTLLEASARRTPTVCLPPQNLSQFANAQRFADATGKDFVVSWPEGMLDVPTLDRAKLHGEEAALAVIYETIGRAAQDPKNIEPEIARDVRNSILASERDADWGALAQGAGIGGSAQIAGMIAALSSVTLAPRGRGSRAIYSGGRQQHQREGLAP